MLMGTKWGVSPWWITEGEEKHVFSCIHMETWDPSLFLPFFPLLSLSQTNESSDVCYLHAPLITALWDLTDFEIHCQSVNVCHIP